MCKKKKKIACTRCRRKKIKCSGEIPCDKCAKYNLECKYLTNENSSNDSAGILQSGQYSSDGLASMQHKEARPNTDTNNMSLRFRNGAGDARSQKYTVSKNMICKPYWRITHRFQNILYLNLYNSNLNRLLRDIKMKVRKPRVQYYGWNMSGLQYVGLTVMPERPKFDFSTVHELLLKYYFDEINPVLGIMNAHFLDYFLLKDHENIKINMNDPVKLGKEDALLLAILHLIYSISIRFMEFEKMAGLDVNMLKIEESSFEFAYHLISTLSFEIVSLELIRAWLLATFYLRVSHTQRSCMAALDQANCMARSMGLHLSEMSDIQEKEPGKTEVKKVFWCLYTFDQLYSIQIGREAFWSRKEIITIKMPTLDVSSKSDEAFPLPFFGMLKLALLAKDVSGMYNNELIMESMPTLIQKIDNMHLWLSSYCFFDKNDASLGAESNNLPFFKEQVLLQFYDIIFCFYGPIIQSYVTRDFSNVFVSPEGIIHCWKGVLEVLKSFKSKLVLKRPWPLNLMLMFCIGITSLVMINEEAFTEHATGSYKEAIKLLSFLANESVPSNQFPMAKEALLALNQCSKVIQIRTSETLESMKSINIGLGDEILKKKIPDRLKENDEASLPYKKSKSSISNEAPSFPPSLEQAESIEDYPEIVNEIDWFGAISDDNLFIDYDFSLL